MTDEEFAQGRPALLAIRTRLETGMMTMRYPCDIRSVEGGFLASFTDVPEALTGAATIAETVELAADALTTALAGHANEGRAIPLPSPAAPENDDR